MIRRATLEDVPALLDMGGRFSERAKLQSNVGYDPVSMKATFEALITNGHPVFISETGAIGATLTNHPFNASHVVAQELFWWSEGGEGAALLDALESYCSQEADSLIMIALEAIRPEAVGRLYERRGFVPLERSFVKVF
jgi:GNAT superfamily N-acetyltransferase